MKSKIQKMLYVGEYTVEDLRCQYCLYYTGEYRNPCSIPNCCCEEDRIEAIKRERQKVQDTFRSQ